MNSLPFANIGKIGKWFGQCDNADISIPRRKINILLQLFPLIYLPLQQYLLPLSTVGTG